MSRKMKSPNGNIVTVVEHIMTKNLWEYYVLEADTNTEDIKLCAVMGIENEIGDVSMKEIKPYVISRTTNFNGLLPYKGWQWV